jgi:hypothetical protein
MYGFAMPPSRVSAEVDARPRPNWRRVKIMRWDMGASSLEVGMLLDRNREFLGFTTRR